MICDLGPTCPHHGPVPDPNEAASSWHMTGVVSPRVDSRPPRLKPMVPPGDWGPDELVDGVANINIRTYADEPMGFVLDVRGTDPGRVHTAWHRVARQIRGNTAGWFGYEEPF